MSRVFCSYGDGGRSRPESLRCRARNLMKRKGQIVKSHWSSKMTLLSQSGDEFDEPEVEVEFLHIPRRG